MWPYLVHYARMLGLDQPSAALADGILGALLVIAVGGVINALKRPDAPQEASTHGR